VLLALVLAASLCAYALLGGADYGGGLWDLLAWGPAAPRQRALIAHAIGPVWEANHVWLIVAVVVLFAGFPRAYAVLSTYLHVPLTIALLGIVLRGSAFVFRAYGPDDARHQRFWGRVFSVSSTVTPFFLGVVVGAISDGRLPARADGSFTEIFLRPWVTPFSLSVGALAVALFGYLAAVYLTVEAREPGEQRAFRLRALASWAIAGVLAVVVLALSDGELRRGLLASRWSIPVFTAAAVSAVAALVALAAGRFALARLAAAAQVAAIVLGWALAQFPYAIRPHVTLAAAAAPEPVRLMLLQILAAGGVLLLPCLFYLFTIFGPRGRKAPSDLLNA
jgi:cytochrome d ubiquinol oxidase subunit II